MAGRSETAEKITTALAEYLKRDPATIHPDYHLRDDLGLDSMAVIELVYRIEEAFNLQIPDEDLGGMTTVEHVIAYVESRQRSRAAERSASPPVTSKATSAAASTRKAAASKSAKPKMAASKDRAKRTRKRS